MNEYYVTSQRKRVRPPAGPAYTGVDWLVIRRANPVNGNAICTHISRSSARKCCWGRNGGAPYKDDICS